MPPARTPEIARPLGVAPPAPLSGEDFARLAAFIERRCGIRMPPAKRTMLEGRLARRVRALGMRSFEDYCRHVLDARSEDELVHMVDAVTTNKTDFFREPQHFHVLVQEVLPALEARCGAGVERGLRVWSAGCSTGEEPYTLAMVLAEASRPGAPPFEVLATDLSSRVLRRAREATYSEADVAPVPLHLRRRHLVRSAADPDVVRVRRTLRERVRFEHLNLLDRDYRIARPQDVVFCRNVFIYFERAVQHAIVERFARHLVPGGFLFLGHSETLNGLDVPFDAIAPTVYRRREQA